VQPLHTDKALGTKPWRYNCSKLKNIPVNESAMDLPRVKYFRGKIVPHLDLWAGTTAGGLNQAKKAELHKTLEDKEIDAFCIFEANVMEETIKYFHFKNYYLNFLPKS
jgi:hypothetical protein